MHLSGDFPDPIDPHKTRAIEGLINLTASQFDHRVISINRQTPRPLALAAGMLRQPVAPPLAVDARPFGFGIALAYRAPPRGLYHRSMLSRLGEWLAGELQADPPDLLVGHKLTIEGIAVAVAAAKLDLPYALSIQGDTDLKILTSRPDLTSTFARVFHGAQVVFPFSPWALRAVETALGRRMGPSVCLPCPSELDTVIRPRPGGERLVSLFHLKSLKRKNLAGMVRAMQLADSNGERFRLGIAGGGEPADLAAASRITSASGSIDLLGPLARDQVACTLNSAIGFVLPSRRETFGIVFIEALFAGTPIIYPEGQAVSGYFDDAPFAIPVDPNNPLAIAAAMARLVREEDELKAALACWQHSEAAQRFTRGAIGKAFGSGLELAIRTKVAAEK